MMWGLMLVRYTSVSIKRAMLTGTDVSCRDRLEVRTLRCGRNNPGSNPGHGIIFNTFKYFAILRE